MLHPNFIDNITTIYETKHLYKYSRFWVAKLIVSLEEIYNYKLEWEFGILNEADYEMLGIDMPGVEHKVLSFCDTLADENDWVFNSLGISLLTKKLPTEETRDRLFKLLRNTENNYAKTIYLGAITGFDVDYIAEHFEDYLLDCLRSDSIDVQIVALRVLQQAKDEFTLLADTSEFTQRFFGKWEDNEVSDEEPKTVSAVTINFNAETTINILDQESMGFDSDKKTSTVDSGKIMRCGHLELLAEAGVLKFKTE